MNGVTKEERINLVALANSLCAPPKPIPAIRENLNEACNRRAQLALATVIAAIKARKYAIETEEPANEAQKVSAFAKLVLIEDLMDDLNAIKKGFGQPLRRRGRDGHAQEGLMHTEEEARKLWCPMVRVGNGNEAAENRTCEIGKVSDDLGNGTTWNACIASSCMMWRWDNDDFGICKQTGECVPFQGYCGLGGKS